MAKLISTKPFHHFLKDPSKNMECSFLNFISTIFQNQKSKLTLSNDIKVSFELGYDISIKIIAKFFDVAFFQKEL